MPRPRLECPDAPSDTGAFQLAWSGAPEGAEFRLKEGDTIIYEGPNVASAISGRLEGSYVYAVGVLDGDDVTWSEACTVSVAPPSLVLALVLFAVGLLITLGTVAVVVRGHGAHRRGEIG